jgi:quercetin dioxygenase-like cupin family protein
MRSITAATIMLALTTTAIAAQPSAAKGPGASAPSITWGPAPAVFPAGAQMAVLQGNPGSSGLFTVRLRLPDGYKIAPHTHPTDEHVTVISGTFRVGMGETFDAKKTMALAAGGFVTAPAHQAHYAIAEGPTVVQVHALGPFALTYVHPADAPQAKPGQ